MQPGDYTATANFVCGGSGGGTLVESSTHTFHVVAGNPPTISDRDLDGVSDAGDQCPDIPGPASNGGCPVFDPPAPTPPQPKDPDGDGVVEGDQCPQEDGPDWSDGCEPKVPKAPGKKAEQKARTRAFSQCSLTKLRREARRKAPAMKGGAQVAKLKRCYAKTYRKCLTAGR